MTREVHPSRRALLASAGALALAGCLPTGERRPPRPDPDLQLRARVAADIGGLVLAYAAAADAFPALAGRLAPLAAEHDAHVRALRGPDRTPSAAGSPGTAPSGSSAPASRVPADRAGTLRWLTGLERQAARRRQRQALRAGPDLARLLASVGACESVHAMLLEQDR